MKGLNGCLLYTSSTQNAADAFSAVQTKLNGAKSTVKETAAEIDQCNRKLALTRTSWASAGEVIQASQRSIASIGKQMKTAESSYRLAAAGVKDFDKSAAGLTAKLALLQDCLLYTSWRMKTSCAGWCIKSPLLPATARFRW